MTFTPGNRNSEIPSRCSNHSAMPGVTFLMKNGDAEMTEKLDMTFQMTNSQLSMAIRQTFIMLRKTARNEESYKLIFEHMDHLMMVQRSRAAACLLKADEEGAE